MLLIKIKPLPKKGGFTMSKCCNDNEHDITGGNAFAGLIVFVLIILQFRGHHDDGRDHENDPLFDNSVLFILALFFLLCCCKVKLSC
jgi:heme O synthase-like polyprenyltransferase